MRIFRHNEEPKAFWRSALPRNQNVYIYSIQVILRISLAQFFVQFTKLWPSIYGILESFARGMNIDEFWTIMAEILNQVNAGRFTLVFLKFSFESSFAF